MIGGVTRRMLPHLPGVPHLHVHRSLAFWLSLSFGSFLLFLVCHDTEFLFSTRAVTALGWLPNAHQDMIILVRPRKCNVEKTNNSILSCSKIPARSARTLTLDKTRAFKMSPKYCILLLMVDMYFKSGFSFTSQRPIKITKVGEQWSCAQIVRQMFAVEASPNCRYP